MSEHDVEMTEMETYSHSSHNDLSREISYERLFCIQNMESDDYEATSLSAACKRPKPYATLIAGMLCSIGVGMFCVTMYHSVTPSVLMLNQIFHICIGWQNSMKILLVLIAIGMIALTLMVIYFGFLTTGETCKRVYRTIEDINRGDKFCKVLIGIIYLLQYFWIFIFGFLTVAIFIITVFSNMCRSAQVQDSQQCIDFTLFYFLFPQKTRSECLKICDTENIQFFCKNFIDKSELKFAVGIFGVILIIISLVHYLICLSANHAYLIFQDKIIDLKLIHLAKGLDFITSMGNYKNI